MRTLTDGELDIIREQEEDARASASDTCEECCGAGIIASAGQCGDQCGGWAETCPECSGTGVQVASACGGWGCVDGCGDCAAN